MLVVPVLCGCVRWELRAFFIDANSYLVSFCHVASTNSDLVRRARAVIIITHVKVKAVDEVISPSSLNIQWRAKQVDKELLNVCQTSKQRFVFSFIQSYRVQHSSFRIGLRVAVYVRFASVSCAIIWQASQFCAR